MMVQAVLGGRQAFLCFIDLAVGRDGTLGAHSNPGQGMQGLEVSLGVGQT